MNIRFHNTKKNPNKPSIKRSSLTHILIELSKVKDRNFENGKIKDTEDIRGNSYKSVCRFLCRNFADHEIVDNLFKIPEEKSFQSSWGP